jgi:DNA-binding NtrC family response regulator
VRELRNIVIRLTTKYAGESVNSEQLVAELDPEQGQVAPADPQPGVDQRSAVDAAKRQLQTQKNFSLDETLQRLERSYVEAALALTNGNLSQAAKLLGVHRTTLYSRMQNYGGAAMVDSNPADH